MVTLFLALPSVNISNKCIICWVTLVKHQKKKIRLANSDRCKTPIYCGHMISMHFD